MSFAADSASKGFSIGDVIVCSKLAFSAYQSLKDGPKEFEGLRLEVLSLNTTLRALAEECNSPNSIILLASPQRQESLRVLLENCSKGLEQLHVLTRKFPSLGPNEKTKFLEHVRFALRDKNSPRDKLAIHTSSINIFLTSLTHSSLGRLEGLVKNALRGAQQKQQSSQSQFSNAGYDTTGTKGFNVFAAGLDTGPQPASSKESDVWSSIAHDVEWEGIKPRDIESLKDEIVAYIRYLHSGGEPFWKRSGLKTEQDALQHGRVSKEEERYSERYRLDSQTKESGRRPEKQRLPPVMNQRPPSQQAPPAYSLQAPAQQQAVFGGFGQAAPSSPAQRPASQSSGGRRYPFEVGSTTQPSAQFDSGRASAAQAQAAASANASAVNEAMAAERKRLEELRLTLDKTRKEKTEQASAGWGSTASSGQTSSESRPPASNAPTEALRPQQSPSGFGSPNAGGFGQSPSAFGSSNTGGFGQNSSQSGSTANPFAPKTSITSGSLFGSAPATANAPPSDGLYGSAPANAPATGSSGGLFGNSQQTSQSTGGGLFGNAQPSQSGGLFGQAPVNQKAVNDMAELFDHMFDVDEAEEALAQGGAVEVTEEYSYEDRRPSEPAPAPVEVSKPPSLAAWNNNRLPAPITPDTPLEIQRERVLKVKTELHRLMETLYSAHRSGNTQIPYILLNATPQYNNESPIHVRVAYLRSAGAVVIQCDLCSTPVEDYHWHCDVCAGGDWDCCFRCRTSGRGCPGGHGYLSRRSAKKWEPERYWSNL